MSRISDRPLIGKEAAQKILAFTLANACSSRIWNENSMHSAERLCRDAGLAKRSGSMRRPARVSRHGCDPSFQILAFVAMEPPPPGLPSRGRRRSARRRTKSSAEVLIDPRNVRPRAILRLSVEGKASTPNRTPKTSSPEGATTNWRWAGVPFFLRTASGRRRAKDHRAGLPRTARDVPVGGRGATGRIT